MPFNVPFIPETEYVRFLNGLGDPLYAIHFSLYDSFLCDARIRFETVDVQTLIAHLKSIPDPKKYLLANGRFHPPELYGVQNRLPDLIRRIEQLQDEDVLDGIIFSDTYLLFALSDAAPDLASRLEAVPSVNFMVDSSPKFYSIIEAVERTRFRMPGKISVDRSLNRRPEALSEMSERIRNRLPGVKIELLANEGCLAQCPFRPTHEAMIAAANAGVGMNTLRMNRDLGCMRILAQSPHLLLASPFIRPEDMDCYDKSADVIKICGRTLGSKFLKRTVSAYTKGRYKGNLVSLLDAANWMADKWEIRNEALPPDFLDTLTACDQNCRQCRTCRDLFQQYGRPLPFRIKEWPFT